MITIANTCNMPLTITGFHNDNPTRFTIINYPEFSGSGYYTTGNVTGNTVSLPKILEPGESWDIMTWWHPKKWEVDGADIGTPWAPTGTAQSGKITVLPGDLGFPDCNNHFVLSGEMICDKVPIELGTGALGTYVHTLSDLPDPPLPTVCLQNSKYVYESFRSYTSATALHDDQPEGLYQLMHWVGRQISGREDENPRIRNISKGFVGAITGVVKGGGDGNLANLFTQPIALADSVLYNSPEGGEDPWTGSFKTSTAVPTGSGTLMQLGQGYTGVNVLESRYDDLGAGFDWQNQNNNYGVYVSSGLTNTSDLTARVFIAQSGDQSLKEGTTIENSICSQPTSWDLGAGPAVVGLVEGDFDYIDFTQIQAFNDDDSPCTFNLWIMPDQAAVDALVADYATAPVRLATIRKGGIVATVNNSKDMMLMGSVQRKNPATNSPRAIIRDPDIANPDDISLPFSRDGFTHVWAPNQGTVGDSNLRSPSVFDLNDNGRGPGALRYASEWIVNGDIEIANAGLSTVVESDGTLNPAQLGTTNMTSINLKKNLTTDSYINVEFVFPALSTANFIIRGAT